jgi:hypothetical protein
VRSVVASLFVALVLCSGPTAASDKRQKHLEHMLKRLDPATRLEQVCDAEAMKQIARDNREFRIDRSVVSAIEEPRARGDTLSGNGAAFRSRGKWSQYSFTCNASPDRLRVIAFEYKLGDEIPEARWLQHGLYQ